MLSSDTENESVEYKVVINSELPWHNLVAFQGSVDCFDDGIVLPSPNLSGKLNFFIFNILLLSIKRTALCVGGEGFS